MNIFLINPPWGPKNKPSMGIHVLQKYITSQCKSYKVEIDYANIFFYDYLSDLIDTTVLENYFWNNPCLFWLSEGLFAPFIYDNKITKNKMITTKYLEYIDNVLKVPYYNQIYPMKLINWLHDNFGIIEYAIEQIIPSFLSDLTEKYYKMKNNIDLIGLSCFFNQTFAALSIAKIFKGYGITSPIVFGGACITKKNAAVLINNFKQIDYIIEGEGETPLLRLINSLEKKPRLSERNNVIYNKQKTKIENKKTSKKNYTTSYNIQRHIDINDVCALDYSQYFHALKLSSNASNNKVILPFETTRGCYWSKINKCSFCGMADDFPIRSKTVKNVYKEITSLYNKHRINHFECADPALPPSHARKLIPMLVNFFKDKSEIKSFFFEVRANLAKKDIYNFSTLGNVTLQPGIESFSSSFLNKINKGTNKLINIQCVKWCSLFKVNTNYNLIFGHPNETERDYIESIETIKKIYHLQPPKAVMQIILLDNSPLYRKPEKYGITKILPWDIYKLLLPNLSTRDRDAFAYYYNFEFNASIRINKIYHYFIKEINEWIENYEEKKYYFFMDIINQNKAIIYDNRPLENGDKKPVKITFTKALDIEIIRYLDSIKTIDEIFNHLRNVGFKKISKTQVKYRLFRLIELNIIISEFNEYLSLPLIYPNKARRLLQNL